MAQTLTDTAVAQAKREILEDIADGTVPSTVRTFSELHDYVDANVYGGMCEGLHEALGGTDQWVAACNDITNRLDGWLRAGRPA